MSQEAFVGESFSQQREAGFILTGHQGASLEMVCPLLALFAPENTLVTPSVRPRYFFDLVSYSRWTSNAKAARI